MKINQKLNFDNPYENLKDGDLVHAGNIMIDKDTETIQNEQALAVFKRFDGANKIVGHIECNQEFLVFFDNNTVQRVHVDKTHVYKVEHYNNEGKITTTNYNGSYVVPITWHWCGGEVFGTYTYNVNNELIISLSELNPTRDCPLKSINIDKDYRLAEYITNENDEFYTELATAPISNITDVNYISGKRIKKGTYIFFIRYWIDDYYNTIWFPIGFPVHVVDREALTAPKEVFKYSTDTKGDGFINDYYNEDDDYTNTNLSLIIRMFEQTNTVFNKFQLAAIVNGNASTEGVLYSKQQLYPYNAINIGADFESYSLTELTNESFNFYNVKTLDNFRNRVYLANYKIANKNSIFDIDSNINAKLNNIVMYASDGLTDNYPTVGDSINFFKPKVGRRGLYTFFIHYVYPNGTYTDGIQINTANVGTLPNGVNETDRITATFVSHPDFEQYVYSCPEDKLFISNIVFVNVPVYEQFVGYFISYEKAEYYEVGSGFITGSKADLKDIITNGTEPPGTVEGIAPGDSRDLRFNYPEFSIVGGVTTAKHIQPMIKFTHSANNALNGNLTFAEKVTDNESAINSTTIIPPNSVGNIGKEGVLGFNSAVPVASGNPVLTMYDLYDSKSLNSHYVNVDKNLVSLGYIEWIDPTKLDEVHTYGSHVTNMNDNNINPTYAWNYYWNISNVYAFHHDGVIFSDVDWNPYDGNGNKFYDDTNKDQTVASKPIIYSFTYVHESHYFLMGKKTNIPPRTVYYNVTDEEGNNKPVANTIVDPSRINDLFILNANYYDFYRRVIINYNDKNELYKKEHYTKTVYRTNVIADESIANSWKHISAESYKLISENKGDITNIVAAGHYLLVHTEKSLFAFDISNELKTEGKDIQMLMPDVFEVNYKEVFTTKYGICGFQDFHSCINADFGYIFYDGNSKKLYKFDAGSVDEINNDLTKFIEDYDADRIYIGYDTANARLLFNFLKKVNNDWNSCILSYSLHSDDWISTHTYASDYRFITLKDDFYIVDSDANHNVIYKFDNTKFNDYVIGHTNAYMNNEQYNNKNCSYIDVYFNSQTYFIIKIVNFIGYIINKNKGDNFDVLGCYLYTNCCYSDYCNLINDRDNVAEYKKPYYEFGRWNFNWFSNKLKDYTEQEIFNRLTGKLNENLDYNQTAVDSKLMVGKYVIVRFVFRNPNKKVLIKDIQAYFNI